MISGKLVHLFVSHRDNIIGRVAEEIRRDPDMVYTRSILGPGLRQWHQELLGSLHDWLSTGDAQTVARHYQHMGKERFKQNVPLHECVKDLCFVKGELLDFVEENIFNKDSMALYAEEELDRQVGRFFDLVTVNMVQGYEVAAQREVGA